MTVGESGESGESDSGCCSLSATMLPNKKEGLESPCTTLLLRGPPASF